MALSKDFQNISGYNSETFVSFDVCFLFASKSIPQVVEYFGNSSEIIQSPIYNYRICVKYQIMHAKLFPDWRQILSTTLGQPFKPLLYEFVHEWIPNRNLGRIAIFSLDVNEVNGLVLGYARHNNVDYPRIHFIAQ